MDKFCPDGMRCQCTGCGETCARLPSSAPPTCYTTVLEECRLEAHNTGDGWSLAAVDKNGEVVCYLAFPKAWGNSVSSEQLRSYGFEVV